MPAPCFVEPNLYVAAQRGQLIVPVQRTCPVNIMGFFVKSYVTQRVQRTCPVNRGFLCKGWFKEHVNIKGVL